MRYNNKYLMCDEHVRELFQLKKISRESADQLRSLVDNVSARVNSLTSLCSFEEITNAFIVHLVLMKLDINSQTKVEETIDFSNMLNWQECSAILQKRCQVLESHNINSSKSEASGRNEKRTHAVSFAIINDHCKCCKQTDHQIWKCDKFLTSSPTQRYDIAKANQLCINCLSANHATKQCKSSTCKQCKQRHHTLLHRGNNSLQNSKPQQLIQKQQQQLTQQHQYLANQLQPNSQQQQSHNTLPHQQQNDPHNQYAVNSAGPMNNSSWSPTSMVSQQCNTSSVSSTLAHAKDHTILATVVLNICDKFGKHHTARALLDSASQLNFITRSFSQKLALNAIKGTTVVGGIGELCTKASYSTHTQISSRNSEFKISLPFLVLPSITGLQPDCEINVSEWDIPLNINLADPKFNMPQKIDVLLGADVFFQILKGEQIQLKAGCPYLLNTKFGWIAAGKCQVNTSSNTSLISSSIDPEKTMQLEAMVKQFWSAEQLPEANRKMSKEHTHCENFYIQTFQRNSDGRFIVRLPLKNDPQSLGDSKQMATRRFLNLEKRLAHDANLHNLYSEFLQQYLKDGHMEQVDHSSLQGVCYYLPHHCVLKPEKSTTKCRVVFDASAPSTSGISLNDILMTGPVVQKELFDILLRFRFHKYGLMGDISAMYRQILVHADDQNLLNILWRNSSSNPIQTFRLKTVTYRTASAPYLATRCLIQLADEEPHDSVAANIIRNDFYVDDMITGGNTLQELQTIKHDVSSILTKGQFHLRKWCSNHHKFLSSIPEEDREKTISINNAAVVKALGVIWDPNNDCFKFKWSTIDAVNRSITKRNVLSELSRLFDPLGFIKPVIVKAKIFLQELWLKKFNWDEQLPEDMAGAWQGYVEQLSELNKIQIPRYVLQQSSSIQLHGFCDASTRAYGCCFYIRCTDTSGNHKINLFTARSKVAPISSVKSLPCLELCGAHTLAQLLPKLQNLYPFDKIIMWSDSVIVLGWLAEHASNLNTFVANRVSFIQEATSGVEWRYVPSKQNPADIISRGATVLELSKSIWFTGPEFLYTSCEHWPQHPKKRYSEILDNLPERRTIKPILLTTQGNWLLNKIYETSDFTSICRRVAYIRRFTSNSRSRTQRLCFQTTLLTINEIDDALLNIISIIQNQHYNAEIKLLLKEKEVMLNSTLKSLNPFIEQYKNMVLLKVGGRLRHAQLPYAAKHPLVLPKNNPFVFVYFRYLHIKNLHAGPQVLLSLVRERLWVIGAREYARKTVQNCVHCFKYKPKLLQQVMGDLPAPRVVPANPFSYCGVDFCGPILTSIRVRGNAKIKSYIAVFVCFVTRAVHLEVVSDLTADAFLGALKRFVARRGICKILYCDNATNFVGARNILKEFRTAFLSSSVQTAVTTWCTASNIQFKHIPPRSPHFGGLWEAAVKSAKTILYKTMQSAVLTFEELTTVVAQVESILNSRPLTALSTDPSDESALTPAHFLNQSPTECIVEPNTAFEKISCYKHWLQTRALQQHFWKRWSKEYLTTLQQRRKWDTSIPNIDVGTLVLIHEDNLPPQKWLLGRVIKVFPGADHKVRVAEIKTKAGIFRRAVAKLAAIPIDNSVTG